MEMEVNENPETDGKVNVYVIGPANTAIALYDGDPALGTATYIRGLSLVAAVRDGARTYYHYNAHGDVVQLTNSSGTVTKNYTYDAFGVEQDASDGDLNPFRYCGEQFDDETGNYYLRARYYSPEVGRFTQEDTHWNPGNMIYGDELQKWNEWQGEEDPLNLHAYTYKPEIIEIIQAENLYIYCWGNPIRWKDSTGNRFDEGKVYEAHERGKGKTGSRRSLPRQGEPDSTDTLYKPDGSLKQKRKYGPSGLPEVDRDYDHEEHGHGSPHDHWWDKSGSKRGPAEAPKEGVFDQIQANDDAEWGFLGLTGTAFVLYLIISEGSRILFPPRNLVPVL